MNPYKNTYMLFKNKLENCFVFDFCITRHSNQKPSQNSLKTMTGRLKVFTRHCQINKIIKMELTYTLLFEYCERNRLDLRYKQN